MWNHIALDIAIDIAIMYFISDGISRALCAICKQSAFCLQPWYDALKCYHFLLPNDVAKKKLKAESWHLDVSRLAEEVEQAMMDDENKYQTEMLAEQEGFTESLNDISNMVAKFEGFVDLGNLDYVVKEAKLIQEKLKQADKDAEVFNCREAIFGLPTTDYSPIKKITDTFDPFLQFWSCASTWKVWLAGRYIYISIF